MHTSPILIWHEQSINTPIGQLIIWLDHNDILQFVGWQEFRDATLKQLSQYYPNQSITLQPTKQHLRAATSLMDYFEGNISIIDTLAVAQCGTEFQKKVWHALRTIPAGSTTSYGDLAKQIGMPNASRAVGMANNRNPIAIVVPCHRVVGKNNQLVGYAGGLHRKQWLLKHEQRHFKQSELLFE